MKIREGDLIEMTVGAGMIGFSLNEVDLGMALKDPLLGYSGLIPFVFMKGGGDKVGVMQGSAFK